MRLSWDTVELLAEQGDEEARWMLRVARDPWRATLWYRRGDLRVLVPR